MAANPVPVAARFLPSSGQFTAGGGFTLPQSVFIPHPSLQAISTGRIPSPGGPVHSLSIQEHPGIQLRPYPTPDYSASHGIRLANIKATP